MRDKENGAVRIKYKFGVTQWGMPGDGLYAVRLANEAGLDGVHLELGSYAKGYPLAQERIQDAYLEDGAKYGIEFPALVLNDLTVNDFAHGRDSEKGRIAYEQIKIGLKAASRMKIKVVSIPSFLSGLIEDKRTFDESVKALQFCCDEAGQYGITIMHEAALRADEHIRFIKEVGRPNIKILFDTMNYRFTGGHDQVDTLHTLYPYIIDQVHVKDGVTDLSGALLGKGSMDFYKQMDYLVSQKYQGWFIMENYYCESPLRNLNEEDQLSLLIKDLQTVKSALGN
ncbi:MAG TPA: sugar phosphate isomerase/epimerase family protein [Anaerovoracaceae bacterium]|nr:sugar phosphate isomerase/epimerase family protein [Anaerovoracaceae bacterium]